MYTPPPLTMGEEIVLLALDNRTGALRSRQSVGWAVAGAALMELSVQGRIGIDRKKLHLVDARPTGNEALDESLRWLVGKPAHPSLFAPRVRGLVNREARRGVGKIQTSLVQHGVVRLEPGLLKRYPVLDPGPEKAVRAMLDQVVLGGYHPDARIGGLIALLHTTKLHKIAFPGHRPRDLKPRMKEISEGNWAAAEVKQAIAAAAAAVAASVAAASSAGS
ncbi:GPP34 family phosphoprotein [Streptomyces sp. P38-E01]|uniref:GPP34 family phosphoprotein n=1 Tax=Streptomyces tardus TaxID=2780544 RepID=A0A949JC69_9ACTN|nr:GPP34 family phosphoprotein [Streptomyces tardus]MBU7597146.1 GPP34 family phosphoprotein [Streptomyces tardus]